MERDINYLNSRAHWEEMGCRGVYPKDHNRLVRQRRIFKQAPVKIGIDPIWLANWLGPQCLLVMESDNKPFHTAADYQRWLKSKEGDL